jgi:putative ABC transport system substrate-binding protein
VIVAGNSAAVKAAATAAPHTPIVLISGNVLEAGLVKSLARPGGMITGMANFQVELIGKHVELLLEVLPKVRRIGFLIDPKTLAIAAFRDASQKAAKRFSLGASLGEAGRPEELGAALNRMAKEGVQAIVVTPSAWFPNHVQSIMQFAFAHRIPVVVAASLTFAEAGALIAYGGDLLAQIRRTAYFVDRILKGAKPGDLPIEQPTKFELVINLKTAKALGLTIPPSVMVRATRVIE